MDPVDKELYQLIKKRQNGDLLPVVTRGTLVDLCQKGFPLRRLDADHVLVGAIKCRIAAVDDTEIADAIIVCGTDSHFLDDVRTNCADCGTAIVHRPHTPATGIKLCMGCATKRLKQEGA